MSSSEAMLFKDKKTGRVPELDGVRGCAILLVVFVHYVVLVYGGVYEPPTLLWSLCGMAWSGVDLFFVLSGFLIGGILLDNKSSPGFFRVFYVRRSCRIIPLYFAWLGVFFLLPFLFPILREKTSLFEDAFPLWVYGGFVQNIVTVVTGSYGASWLGVTWSLAVEEQFYLLLPALIRLLPNRYLWKVLVVLTLAAPLSRLLLFLLYTKSSTAAYVLLPCRADALMIGVLVAMAVRTPRINELLTRNIKGLYMFAGAMFLVILSMIWSHGDMRSSVEMMFYGYTVLALFYASILLLAVKERKGVVCSIMRWRPLRVLGVIAFGVYLFHEPVNALVFTFLRHKSPEVVDLWDLGTACLSFAITIALAALSWKFFEKPIVRWGHRMKYQIPSHETSALATSKVNVP